VQLGARKQLPLLPYARCATEKCIFKSRLKWEQTVTGGCLQSKIQTVGAALENVRRARFVWQVEVLRTIKTVSLVPSIKPTIVILYVGSDTLRRFIVSLAVNKATKTAVCPQIGWHTDTRLWPSCSEHRRAESCSNRGWRWWHCMPPPCLCHLQETAH